MLFRSGGEHGVGREAGQAHPRPGAFLVDADTGARVCLAGFSADAVLAACTAHGWCTAVLA